MSINICLSKWRPCLVASGYLSKERTVDGIFWFYFKNFCFIELWYDVREKQPFYLLIHLFRVSSLSLLHGAIYSLYRCEETIRRCFFSSFYWCLFYLFFHSIGPVYCFIILDLYVCEHQVVVLREFWPMQSLMAVALESNQSCPTLSVQSLLFYRWPRPPIEK